eukprot:m.62941 g.62941  ORF g.62941 m.62941 type:complete len:323 (+) comp17737_c0_seq1:316-1284(+)
MNPMMGLSELDVLHTLQSPDRGFAGWDTDILDSGMMVPDMSMTEDPKSTHFESEIDALVMATYGGPLIKQASRDNMLKLPAPLNKTDSFDSLIGILKSLPDTDCGSPIRSRHVPTPSVPFPSIPPPFEGSRRKKRLSSVMTSEAFAPLSLSPNRLAAKVEALQRKLMGGGVLAPAKSGQIGSFKFKLNSSSASRPIAQGEFSGVLPWKVLDDEAELAVEEDPPQTPPQSTLKPGKPPLVRGGSFTIVPKRRRVTAEIDDALELAVGAAVGVDDPLIDTYLDICFFDSPQEDSSTVLSIDHDEYADLIKAFEIDTAGMPDILQ